MSVGGDNFKFSCVWIEDSQPRLASFWDILSYYNVHVAGLILFLQRMSPIVSLSESFGDDCWAQKEKKAPQIKVVFSLSWVKTQQTPSFLLHRERQLCSVPFTSHVCWGWRKNIAFQGSQYSLFWKFWSIFLLILVNRLLRFAVYLEGSIIQI